MINKALGPPPLGLPGFDTVHGTSESLPDMTTRPDAINQARAGVLVCSVVACLLSVHETLWV